MFTFRVENGKNRVLQVVAISVRRKAMVTSGWTLHWQKHLRQHNTSQTYMRIPQTTYRAVSWPPPG